MDLDPFPEECNGQSRGAGTGATPDVLMKGSVTGRPPARFARLDPYVEVPRRNRLPVGSTLTQVAGLPPVEVEEASDARERQSSRQPARGIEKPWASES